MLKRMILLGFVGFLLSSAVYAQDIEIDRSRARNLSSWKPQIQRYSEKHYGESTWRLDPTCIVLHYTVTKNFPWNLVNTESFAGESPGLAVHYVIKDNQVWEILPPDVRSRGCYGINHRAINIEMVAMDADDLATKPETLKTCQKLCKLLMTQYGIEKSHIYGHQDVATMSRRNVPECLDLVTSAPYHKIDPGAQNMKTILDGIE
jgi:N-acetyl-anhydromuramyl-L-alanine amidase AmpD